MLLANKIQEFRIELGLIKNYNIKKFVTECLDKAPDYIFLSCPSTSTGKYHFLDEFSPKGNVLHTKRVVHNCGSLARAFELEGKDRDIVIGASILHDIVKQGFEQGGHTVNDHAELAAQMIGNVFVNTKSKIDKKDYTEIRKCVFFHNGIWTDGDKKKSIKDFSSKELCVHMADYTASHIGSLHKTDDTTMKDIFDELKSFSEEFKIKHRFDDIRDIPVICSKYLGNICGSLKKYNFLSEALMSLAAICIKAVLYVRIKEKEDENKI